MENLLADLRLRGFGWLAPDKIARRLEPIAARRTAFWDEILRNRPREPVAPKHLLQVRPRFRWAHAGLAAAVVLFLIGVSSWLPRGFLRASYNNYSLKVTRDSLRLADLKAYVDPCSEHPLDAWAQAAANDSTIVGSSPEKIEMGLDCLARLRPPGAARAFLESLGTAAPPEPRRLDRRRGRHVALLLALGEPAVEEVCRAAVDSPSPEGRLVAFRALGLLATPRSTQCYLDATFHGDPGVRASAAASLGALALGARVGAGAAFEVATRLARDTEPEVRAAAAASLALFDERNARKRLTPLVQDADAAVRAAAEQSLGSLELLRKIEDAQQLGR
jgi:hypothetical protein